MNTRESGTDAAPIAAVNPNPNSAMARMDSSRLGATRSSRPAATSSASRVKYVVEIDIATIECGSMKMSHA